MKTIVSQIVRLKELQQRGVVYLPARLLQQMNGHINSIRLVRTEVDGTDYLQIEVDVITE